MKSWYIQILPGKMEGMTLTELKKRPCTESIEQNRHSICDNIKYHLRKRNFWIDSNNNRNRTRKNCS